MKRCAVAALACVAWLGVACGALAAPVTFHFEFAGEGGARAFGTITLETTLLANPGSNEITLPNPAVLDLQVTVAGAPSGNGQYTLGDFEGISFDTGDATLDLSRQLVGQPTPGGPWGTPSGDAGDFNLFSPDGPNGVYFFTLFSGGPDGVPMALQSMTPNAPVDVPATTDAGLAALATLIACAAAVTLARRRVRPSRG
jgi:hypothetical protein